MIALALVVLTGVLVLFRLSTLRTSPQALLLFAVPAAMLPISAGVVIGVWQFRAVFERIGQTGSGGFATVLGASEDWIRLLFAGCLMGLSVVAAAILLARARRDRVAMASSRGQRTFPAVVLVLVVAAAASLPFVLARSERAALSTLDRLIPISTTGLQPDFGYRDSHRLTNQQLVVQLERDIRIATVGGTAVLVVFSVWIMVGTRVRQVVGTTSVTVLGTVVAAVVVAASAGAWYGLHLAALRSMLRYLAA